MASKSVPQQAGLRRIRRPSSSKKETIRPRAVGGKLNLRGKGDTSAPSRPPRPQGGGEGAACGKKKRSPLGEGKQRERERAASGSRWNGGSLGLWKKEGGDDWGGKKLAPRKRVPGEGQT